MSAITLPKKRMNVSEFLAWAEAQPQSRYELVGGEIIAMAPERVRHNLVKASAFRALDNAVRAAKAPCTVFTDGIGVAINDETVREPDASVQCGVEANLDAMIIEAPLIVVEVSSPSSERDDSGTKLVDYFSVPSIRHYLVILPEKRAVVHHQKNEGATISTRIAYEGEITLVPPGITISVAALLGPPAGAEDR
jgi:Uma2 family endonuclease